MNNSFHEQSVEAMLAQQNEHLASIRRLLVMIGRNQVANNEDVIHSAAEFFEERPD